MFDFLTKEQFNEKYPISDPWDWVTYFENAVAKYTGYKYGVGCDSNTNGIRLCLDYLGFKDRVIKIPAKTYISVANQIILSGNSVEFLDKEWYGEYLLEGADIIDSACSFEKNNRVRYIPNHYRVLSFHHRKIVNIGRGGMILTDDEDFVKWARFMIYDGRDKNVNYSEDKIQFIGHHMYLTPEEGKKGLEILHSGKIHQNRLICGDHTSYTDLRDQPVFHSETYNTEILSVWDNTYYERNLERRLEKINKKNIAVLLPQEPFLWQSLNGIDDYRHIDKVLKSLDKKCTFYCGSDFDENINKECENLKVVRWDSIDYFSKASPYKHPSLLYNGVHHKDDSFDLLKYMVPSKHFSIMTYVKGGRSWRGFVVEELFKSGLDKKTQLCVRTDSDMLNKNSFGFLQFETYGGKDKISYKPKYWNPDIDIPYKSNQKIDWFLNKTPPEYMMGAFDIVNETICDFFFVTEKTLRPIMSEKPFMVFTCQHFHKKLVEEYGFKLYTELFDYSFDDEIDITKRFLMQVGELMKIGSLYTPEEIYNLTRETAKHNYEILNKLRNTKFTPNVPEFLYNIIEKRDYRE